MPLDPVRVADARAWLAKAANDLRGGEVDLQAQPPLLDDAAFHAQQAIEKALKGLLAWHDRPFRKTHDLGELGALSSEIEPQLESLLRAAAPLTEYAWKFRYPGDEPLPTREESERALGLARRVVAAVLDTLPPDVRP